jgi:hypothetical protein
MAKTKKAGRPPKPARLKRTRRLHLLLTAAEFKELRKYSEQRHMTASEVLRGCLRSLLEVQPVKGDTV